MNHQVLARKWRPKCFEEIAGQEHVLRSLKNALNQNRLHSSYLFTGTRGVGKTTLARILATALNCEHGVTASPCHQCKNCIDIMQGRFPDFYEIDGASYTKVEDIRELLSNVHYAPIQGRFKIYLIDEVHMLSNHSFNALLKTLEEPPDHVVFIFATTEPDKLPPTIISRCMQFCLKALTIPQIEAYLASILQKEQIAFEANALDPIARAAKGSIRDGLTLLNQAIAYSNENLAIADVCALLGTIENDHLLSILEALTKKDANRIMELTQMLFEKSVDFYVLLQSLASLLHQITLLKLSSNTLPSSTPDYSRFIALSQVLSCDEMQKYYQILISGQQDIHMAPTSKIGVDMTLLRMLSVNLIKSPPSLQNQPFIPAKTKHQPSLISQEQNQQPAASSGPNHISTSLEDVSIHLTEKKDKYPKSEPDLHNRRALKQNELNEIEAEQDENIKAIIKAFNAKAIGPIIK